MAADYNRGEMDISQHKSTFGGFMGASVYFTLLTVVLVLFLTLVFAAGVSWFGSLIASVVVGVVGGVALKQKAGYWVSLVLLAGLGFIASVLIGLFAGG